VPALQENGDQPGRIDKELSPVRGNPMIAEDVNCSLYRYRERREAFVPHISCAMIGEAAESSLAFNHIMQIIYISQRFYSCCIS